MRPDPLTLARMPCTRLAAVALTAAALLLGAGCATSGGKRKAIDITVRPDGAVLVGEKPVLLKRLPATLKSQGAGHETGIYISVPDNVSPAVMRQVTETLATAGYGRLIFHKPVKATAGVEAK